MSLINQACRQKTEGCEFPIELEDYIFYLLRKKRHLPQEILEDIKLVKNLQDTLRFVFQNNEVVGIFNDNEVEDGIGRSRLRQQLLLQALEASSEIKIPSRKSTIKIINSLPPGNSESRILDASNPGGWKDGSVIL